MSLKIESRKLWKSFPKTALSITIMTEFQNLCDKIILEVGVVGLRELCEKLLIHLRLHAINIITSPADEDVLILSADECNDDDDDDDDDVATSLTDDEMSVVHSVANRLRVSRKTEDITAMDKIKSKDKSKLVKKSTYPCLQCHKSYIGTVSLNNHVLRKHPLQEKSDTTMIFQNNDSVVANKKNISSSDKSITISQGVTVKSDQDSDVTKSHQDVKCVAECPNLSQRKLSADKGTTSQTVVSEVSLLELSIVKPTNKTLSAMSEEVPPTSHNSEEIVVKCSVCSLTFKNKFDLTLHRNKHSAEEPTLCFECGRSFISASHLRRHQRVHTGELSHVCTICGEAFIDAAKFRKHNLKHSCEERPKAPPKCHVCSQCDNIYGSKTALVAHVRRTHNLDNCPYMCLKCEEKYPSVNDLRIHEVGCNGERSYACLQCGKQFATASSVTMHQRVHTGERPY